MARLEGMRVRVATCLGTGYAPIAPGTAGSLVGLVLVWALWHWGGHWTVLAGAAIVALAGWWSAGVAATRLGERDPGPVVIDEVAGQMVSLLFLAPTMATLITGFLLFRLFDIWKPFPVRRLEKLPAASGIMTDDLMAAVYANLLQRALIWGFPGWWGNA